MKNLKHAIFSLSFLIALLSGCGKAENRLNDRTLDEGDFAVTCLYGHKYLIRNAAGKGYMAPKFDKNTHLPETCSIE